MVSVHRTSAVLLSVLLAAVANAQNTIVTGPGEGAHPFVNRYDETGTTLQSTLTALPFGFLGGVTVALGDVNGDGVSDIITGAGPSADTGPQVSVFSGSNGVALQSFSAFAPTFTGGVYVAAGDVNGDGFADIIVGAGAGGGPQVSVFSGSNGSLLQSFLAFAPTFAGGVRVGSGDVNGDGFADIIVGAGAGGGPQVSVFSGSNGSLLQSFLAFAPTFAGGVFVAGGDVNGDGKADIVVGAGNGGGQVKTFDAVTAASLGAYSPFGVDFTNGVTVGTEGIVGSNVTLLAGTGAGVTGEVSLFTPEGILLNSFLPFGTGTAGVFVGGDIVAAASIPEPASYALWPAVAGLCVAIFGRRFMRR